MNRHRFAAFDLLSKSGYCPRRLIAKPEVLPNDLRHRPKKILRLKCAVDHRSVRQIEKLWIKMKLLLDMPISPVRQKLRITTQANFGQQPPEPALRDIPLMPSTPSQFLLRRKMGIQHKAIQPIPLMTCLGAPLRKPRNIQLENRIPPVR